jgi:hypothetical protein
MVKLYVRRLAVADWIVRKRHVTGSRALTKASMMKTRVVMVCIGLALFKPLWNLALWNE